MEGSPAVDCEYCSVPELSGLEAVTENIQLKEKTEALTQEMQELKIQSDLLDPMIALDSTQCQPVKPRTNQTCYTE